MERLILWVLPSRSRPLWVRYAGTAAIVALAHFLRVAIGGPLETYPFLLFIFAVFVSALLFEHGAGMLATILSVAVVVYTWLPPTDQLWITDDSVIPLFLFTLICLAIALLTEAVHVAVRRIKQSEDEKGLLLQELTHRSKNNLQMICSMMSLQSEGISDPEAKRAFADSVSRVRVIARAHERLRLKGAQEAVDIGTYLVDLCEDLGAALRQLRPIELKADIEPLQLDQSKAVSLGLLVNELVANAFEHAFPAKSGGVVDVSLRRLGGAELQLVVRDNGIGCPKEARDGLGRRLMNLIVLQLDGSIKWDSGDPGCKVIVRLPFSED